MFLILTCVNVSVFSQFSDSFEDGNFSSDPCWIGNTEKFKVDDQGRLQLYAEKEESTAQLLTASSLTKNASWEFDVRVQAKPTSDNHVRVFLCADTTDAGKLWGLCLRIGQDDDKTVSLWYESSSGSPKSLLKGIVDRVNVNLLAISVKATLDWSGHFQLYTKMEGEESYTLEGETTLARSNIPQSKFFGIYCKYTSTRAQGFYFFDNFRATLLSGDPVPVDAEPSDVVINEVLYEPFAGGDEYVEIYNRSDRAIDVSSLSIATRKADGSLQRIKSLASASERALYPEEYLLITGEKDSVCEFYTCYPDIIYCEVEGSMTSLPNDGATIVLFNNQNNAVIDEFTYTKAMHASGLSEKKGVSLERIDPDEATNLSSNWTSASSTAGSGTPGYQNSQYKMPKDNGGSTGIEILEPNLSEGEDAFRILYRLAGTDNRCHLMVFDASGRLIDNVLNNSFLGSNGSLEWRPSSALRPGIYIIFMEVFRPTTGVVEKYKLPVILRR
jgi:hypothetical protein